MERFSVIVTYCNGLVATYKNCSAAALVRPNSANAIEWLQITWNDDDNNRVADLRINLDENPVLHWVSLSKKYATSVVTPQVTGKKKEPKKKKWWR